MMVWWKVGLSKSCGKPTRDGRRRRPLPVLVFLIGGCFYRPSLGAEDNLACPEDNVDECTRYHHLVAGMESGDLVVQLASLRAASQELDPALRALIFGKALKNANLRLRTAGLRYVLSSRSTFDVVVEPPVHPTPAQQKVYQDYGTLTLRAVKIDEKTDEISAFIYNRASGSMIRGGFELGWQFCRLHMVAGEEDMIKGTLRCQYPNAEPVELKESIELS